MDNGISEIDDSRFFLSRRGKTNAKDELDATLEALLNEKKFDDNSTACRFPARKAWLKKQLNIEIFPEVQCKEYDKILKRLNPKSATLVFPSAHINSPASMFGHTFLRINSAYKSKLLSYAINYAANANADTENGVVFAIKGLFGGYYGRYSLLPYYDKLKEYRDTEQRDIWEYDLNLNEEEILRMVKHIWELNGTHSNYYFFTENCSYNMLWFIEIARPSVNLRKYFTYHVIPLETVHAALSENLIKEDHYRASKRTILLKYESLLKAKNLPLPRKLVSSEISIKSILEDNSISTQQKMYILESSIEFLEYSFTKNDMQKKIYLELFHNITKARASLGKGKNLSIDIPPNPINSHRGARVTAGVGLRDKETISFLGLRPVYHSLEDSNYGFLRGTQIEFIDILLSYNDKKIEVENATLISIVSLAQRSEFFHNFSWRTKFGWDKNYLDDKTNFIATLGAGYSWGNKFAYTYLMVDPLFYYGDKFTSAVGGSVGFVFDKYKYMSTNIQLTKRLYDTGNSQNLVKITQSFRLSQNIQLKFKYDYKERYQLKKKKDEETYQAFISYYF
ncbi:DUF4105 domain-containing protein [Sulfurimonas sp.]|uniref:Lnb N-terminal periplasmic domain-containing protein n=1 Tax=Sulfurimonas sp. TaxID=2022749 RepID=UPI002B473509|nr:DUF4105 domain-containing protein [Sulfurimonas sp.]